jgi:apolipoprotein N-acyltransferase
VRPLAATGVVLFALLAVAGWLRVPAGPAPTVPGVQLRLLQPNIAQSLKWQDDQLRQNFQRHLALAREPAADGTPAPTVVIWPETAVPFLLADEPEVRKVIAWATPPGGLTLTGALRREGGHIFNSLLALDAAGEVVAAYDKAHLVPFGEYMPLSGLLNLRRLTDGGDGEGFGAGPGPRTLPLPGLPGASPLICYEVIFPGEVADPKARPGWLLNITNDAWFGHTAGPHQHLAIAQTRAVEEGLPLARAANTGISAIVDPYGRIVAQLALGQGGTVDGPLPVALAATPYARWGDALFWAGVVLTVFTALILTLGRRKR